MKKTILEENHLYPKKNINKLHFKIIQKTILEKNPQYQKKNINKLHHKMIQGKKNQPHSMYLRKKELYRNNLQNKSLKLNLYAHLMKIGENQLFKMIVF